MSFAASAGLGALAGGTILLGLPVARLRHPRPALMAFLTSGSVGVLLFLFFDVLRNASETITSALHTDRARGIGYGFILAAGLAVGLLGLVAFERVVGRRMKRRALPSGPGSMVAPAAAPLATARGGRVAAAVTALSAQQRLAIFIALGIGLHNFSEGLAIGQSSARGAYQLLFVLVIGFGLHNATEGFGVAGSLAGQRVSWRFLLGAGAVAGGPTLLGTLLGYQFTSDAVSILFLALAAGAIVYVVGELQHAGRRIGRHDLAMAGLLCGFLLGYATDLLLTAAGA